MTSVCNARCAHCFYPINAGKNELTLEEIDRFAATLPPIRLLLISGGEPFLRRDLPELIRVYFERCGFFSASIPTNGFSPEEIARAAEKICSFSPDLSLGVTVSIDGFREFHDRVRAVPGSTTARWRPSRPCSSSRARTPNLTAGVTTVFMRDNQREVEEFCEFVYGKYRPNHHALGLRPRRSVRPAASRKTWTSTSTSASRGRSTRAILRTRPGGAGRARGHGSAARSTAGASSTSRARRGAAGSRGSAWRANGSTF